jgi:hypothetical protein
MAKQFDRNIDAVGNAVLQQLADALHVALMDEPAETRRRDEEMNLIG